MQKGESKLEIQQKTESPQIKQEEVETTHEVEQNKAFFKLKNEENAMSQGCLQKTLSAEINKKAHVILSIIKKMDNKMCFLEKGVVIQYVDTYCG